MSAVPAAREAKPDATPSKPRRYATAREASAQTPNTTPTPSEGKGPAR
jgi:hypothetical protein